uniref:Uncharacterized protein n=1 Tax=Rhizophora mucronata TaxID=61149 RepID=A0A2P2PRJ5_RHIMU
MPNMTIFPLGVTKNTPLITIEKIRTMSCSCEGRLQVPVLGFLLLKKRSMNFSLSYS